MKYRRWFLVGFVAALSLFSFYHLSTAGSDYEILTTSDSGFFYGIARDIDSEDGLVEKYDLSHPPEGKPVSKGNQFQSLMLVTFYRGLHTLDPSISLMDVCKYFSPFLFALSVIGAFLTTRELSGDLAGCASALFFTTLVGSIYWSKIGAFDREITLIFFGTWIFYLLARMFRTRGMEMLKFSVLTALLYGMFLITWSGALFIGAIVVAALALVLFEQAVPGSGLIGASILLFGVGYGFSGFDVSELIGIFLFLSGLVRITLEWEAMKSIEENIYSSVRSNLGLIGSVFGVMGISTAIGIFLGGLDPSVWIGFFTQKIGGFLGLGGGGGVSFPRIATEMASVPPSPEKYYNQLAPKLYGDSLLTGITTVLVGLGLTKVFWSSERSELLALSWLVIVAPMPLSQARFFRLFWPMWPVLAGFGFGALVWMIKKTIFSQNFATGSLFKSVRQPVGLALVAVVLITPYIQNARDNATETSPVPHGGTLPSVYHALVDSYEWLGENTNENAVVAVEWSHGHLLTGVAGRASVTDGAQNTGWRDEWRDSSGIKPPDYIRFVKNGKGYIIGMRTGNEVIFTENYQISGRRPDIEERYGLHSLYKTTEENELKWLLQTYRDNFGVKIDYIVYNEGPRRLQGTLRSLHYEFLRHLDKVPSTSSGKSLDNQGGRLVFEFENDNIVFSYNPRTGSVIDVATQEGKRIGGVMISQINEKGGYDIKSHRFFPDSEKKNLLFLLLNTEGNLKGAFLFDFEGPPMIYRAALGHNMPDFLKRIYSTTEKGLYGDYESRVEIYEVLHEKIPS